DPLGLVDLASSYPLPPRRRVQMVVPVFASSFATNESEFPGDDAISGWSIVIDPLKSPPRTNVPSVSNPALRRYGSPPLNGLMSKMRAHTGMSAPSTSTAYALKPEPFPELGTAPNPRLIDPM